MLSLGTFAIGAAYLGFAAAPSLAVACVAALAGGIGNGLQWPSLISIVQRITPQNLHGRLMGAVESLGALCTAIGLPHWAVRSWRSAHHGQRSWSRELGRCWRPRQCSVSRPTRLDTMRTTSDRSRCRQAGLKHKRRVGALSTTGRAMMTAQLTRRRLLDRAGAAADGDGRRGRLGVADGRMAAHGAARAAARARAGRPVVQRRDQQRDPQRVACRDRDGNGSAGTGAGSRLRRCRDGPALGDAATRTAPMADNLSAFAVVPFCGGLLVRALAGNVQHVQSQHLTESTLFGLIVLGVFMLAVVVNFALIALDTQIKKGARCTREIREVFLPLLPGQLAAGMLATILVVAYQSAGLPMLFGSMLAVDLPAPPDGRAAALRGSRGAARSTLTPARRPSARRAQNARASAQHAREVRPGATPLPWPTMRRRWPASSAAPRRSKDIVACRRPAARDREVHMAGPDPSRRGHRDEDLAIVKDHPQEGAILVGALDGYGPAADAILYHHERVDGRGYPAGLIGSEIPLASRILAICWTYDTMTVADRATGRRWRPTKPCQELRNAARNGQLDGELVETLHRCARARRPHVRPAGATSRPSSNSSAGCATWPHLARPRTCKPAHARTREDAKQALRAPRVCVAPSGAYPWPRDRGAVSLLCVEFRHVSSFQAPCQFVASALLHQRAPNV